MNNPFDEIMATLADIKDMLNNLPHAAAKDEIINRKELMIRLGVTEPTVIRWVKKGVIPQIRIGSHVRYNWPKVVIALENNK